MTHTMHACHEDECFICNGGLALCNVCGGAEASMPTDCPGRRLTADELDAIQDGTINFKDGSFFVVPS